MSAVFSSSGTATVPAVLPVSQDGIITETSLTKPIYDARSGVASDVAYFQELNSFVAAMSASLGITPMSAITRSRNMLSRMMVDRNTGEG